jgi:hypothetical protein
MKVIYQNVSDGRGVKRLFKLVNDVDIAPVPAPTQYPGLRRLRTSRLRTPCVRSGSKGVRQ